MFLLSVRFILLIVCPYLLNANIFNGIPKINTISYPNDDSGSIHSVDALVVGGGLCGASAAFYLDKLGVDVNIIESCDCLGGKVASERDTGYQWEVGPNSFQPTVAILRFLKDLDMLDELVLADPTLPRFVYWDNALRKLPMNFKEIPSFSLLTVCGKIKAGLGFLGFIKPRPTHEETIRDFAIRHFGTEVFERIVDPFVSGVYAGDPKRLSMSAALKKVQRLEDLSKSGGLLSGAKNRMREAISERKISALFNSDLPAIPKGSLGSLRLGMQSMIQRVHSKLKNKVLLSHRLVKVDKMDDKFMCTIEVNGNETKMILCRSLIVTTPAYVTSSLLGGSTGILPDISTPLDAIYYAPVGLVVLAYQNTSMKVPLTGFGHLIPRSTGVRTLGTIWASSLFPGRAPEGHVLLSNFIGGAQDPSIVNLPLNDLVNVVAEDNKKILLHANATQPKVLAVKRWDRAIPQYEIGHTQKIDAVRSQASTQPGLFIGGNYMTGVAVGDCIQYGMDVVQEIQSYLRKP